MYNIKAVSQMLGIPATTIRAWESRYRAIEPERSKGGYRLYSKHHIEDLRWLKKQMEEQGIAISQAVQLLHQKREQSVPLAIITAEEPELSYQSLIDQLYEALTCFRLERANQLLELGFSMHPYDTLFHRVLAPLMKRVGDDWELGRLTVAQEHLVSQFVCQRFYQFFRLFPVNPALPRVLAFCPPGEHHQIGLLLFTLFLRQREMEVLYLGPDTPDDGLSEIIERKQIRIVCISLTTSSHLTRCTDIMERLSAEFPHLTFVLGGNGFAAWKGKPKQVVIGTDRDSWQQWLRQELDPEASL